MSQLTTLLCSERECEVLEIKTRDVSECMSIRGTPQCGDMFKMTVRKTQPVFKYVKR